MTDAERVELAGWAGGVGARQISAMRSRIVLAAADGGSNAELSQRLGLAITTVRRWRNRFAVDRLDGVCSTAGRAARVVGDERIKDLITATSETTPSVPARSYSVVMASIWDRVRDDVGSAVRAAFAGLRDCGRPRTSRQYTPTAVDGWWRRHADRRGHGLERCRPTMCDYGAGRVELGLGIADIAIGARWCLRRRARTAADADTRRAMYADPRRSCGRTAGRTADDCAVGDRVLLRL